ncbi:MAG: apolipoprotein N-acyltransferase [Clostridia bacterium]|nr:apolipoprotein N-acyltransferase [Clostridia bacterium]
MVKRIFNRPDLWLLLGAVATALTLVFPKVGWLEWITMIPIYFGVYRLFEDGSVLRARQAYRYGFLTVYAFYVVVYHWFVSLYPLDFVGLERGPATFVIALAWFGLPLLQAIPGGLIFVFYNILCKKGLCKRAPILRPVAFSALWVLFEWSSTLHWTGVPWGRLALGQIELLPLLQSASLFGSYFVSFLLLLVNGFLAYGFFYRKKAFFPALLAGVIFFSNLSFGVIRGLLPEKGGTQLTAAVIQGNVNSQDKWDDAAEYAALNTYANYTRKAALAGAQIVVWPETVILGDIRPNNEYRAFVTSLARECNVYLFVGAFRYDADAEYNAVYLVHPDGSIDETVYGKRHLVPFGEYVPMRELVTALFPPLAEISMLDSDLTPGANSALFDTPWGQVGALICFDSIYEQLTLDSVSDGADLLLISSNDSWFLDSAAVYQHLAQGQLRAIESGKPILRAANTGISSVLLPDGSSLSPIAALTEGYAVETITVGEGSTLYSRIGNLFVALCALFLFTLWGLGFVIKEKEE